jgi:hypothetical protein
METTEKVTAVASQYQKMEPPKWLNRTVAGAGLTRALGDFC